jgi:hypothetical protein
VFLDKLIDAALSNCWSKLNVGDFFQSPSGKSNFSISKKNENEIQVKIGSEGDSYLTIAKSAFLEALKYLIKNSHFNEDNHCEIKSNNKYEKAGPLCQCVRLQTEPRKITYILPILKFFGFVELANVNGLNSTWLT